MHTIQVSHHKYPITRKSKHPFLFLIPMEYLQEGTQQKGSSGTTAALHDSGVLKITTVLL